MDNGVISLAERARQNGNGRVSRLRVAAHWREWDVDAACWMTHHCPCGGATETAVAHLTIRFDRKRQRLDVGVIRDGMDYPTIHRYEPRHGEGRDDRIRREAVMEFWHGVLADSFGVPA